MRGAGVPTRSTDKFPQDLTKGNIGRRHTPPGKAGMGAPTRSTDKFPQNLTGGKIGRRFTPPA